MGPIRCHYTAIFENVLKFFWQLLPAFILPILTAGRFANQLLIILAAALGCFIVALFLQYLSWRQTWLSIESNRLLIKSGLIWRKQKAIPFKKINTVDLSRNLFQRAVGTCRVKIDTGAVTGGSKHESEVNLIFTLAEAEKIRSQVLTLASGVASLHNDYIDFQSPVDESSPDDIPIPAIKAEMPAGAASGTQYVRTDLPDWSQAANRTFQPKAEIRTRTADFFLYGLTKSKFLGGLIVLFSMITFASEILGDQITETIARLMDTTWQQLSQWYFAVALLAAIGLLLLLYFLASLTSIIFAIVRFYHFRVSREADNIHIEYGLLTVKSYTIPVKNIHAVMIEQNLLRQWLHQCSVEIVSIGYGDEKNEVALLLPLIHMSRLEAAIEKLLPEYRGNLDLTPAPKNALWRFQFVPLLLLLLICGGTALFWPPALFALILGLPILAYDRCLNYRNAGIGYNADRLEVRSGGFHRRRYRVRLSAIQSVGAYSHPLIEKANLCNYRIDYHAPTMRASIQVRFLSASHLDELRRLLDQN